jgi:pimeloyl-ACP methyl ester carboxylesterase
MSLRFFPLFLLSVPYVILAEPLPAKELEVIHLAPSANMDRADLYYVLPIDHPKAVLVLSPGVNGSGENFVRSPAWQQFAQQNHLGLVGLSFASASPDALALRAASQATTRFPPLVVASSCDPLHDGTGYYYASMGSGNKLLEGIRMIYGKDLPLLLCGFSGGAHFTSRFEEWAPSRVIAWCADSAGWWNVPQPSAISPPGIVACGENDPRYGATLSYFKQGRAAGKPWLWVSLPKLGHQASPSLEEFARKYFEAVLRRGASSALSGGVWVDVDTKKVITESEAMAVPSESGWLPDASLTKDWRKIHDP